MFEQIQSENPYTPAPVEIDVLHQMYSDDLLEELLPSFLQETSDVLARLESGKTKKDLRIISTQAHQLKGVAAVLAASQLEGLCCELQNAAQERDWRRVEVIYARVCNCGLEVREFV